MVVLVTQLEVLEQRRSREEASFGAMHLEMHDPPERSVRHAENEDHAASERVDEQQGDFDERDRNQREDLDLPELVVFFVSLVVVVALVVLAHVVAHQLAHRVAVREIRQAHAVHEPAMNHVLGQRIQQGCEREARHDV